MSPNPDPKLKSPNQSGSMQIYETVRKRHKRAQKIRIAIVVGIVLVLAGGGVSAYLFARPQLEEAWHWTKALVTGGESAPEHEVEHEPEHDADAGPKKPDAPDAPEIPSDDDAPPLPEID